MRHYGVTNRGPISTHLIVTGSSGWNTHLANVLEISCSQEVVSDRNIQHIHALPSDTLSTKGWHAALGASLTSVSSQRERRDSDTTVKDVA
jgi:hypothetical protein